MTLRKDDLETTFVTFGTANFSQARARYERSLARFGYHQVLIFDPQSPPVAAARRENPEIFARKKGYGYWLWKPYVIEATFEQVKPGARIVYTDIALEMVGTPAKLFEIAGHNDVCVFRAGGGLQQRMYTKRDTFMLMDADSPEFWNDEMVCGTYLLLRNTDRARDFVKQWKHAMQDARALLDGPSTLGLQELPDFREHRHDQSILSILATRNKFPILADPSQWGRDRHGRAQTASGSERFVPADFGHVFNLHRHRDSPLHRRIARRVRDELLALVRH